ncbi:conserved hypothetical protein [Ricinus communis]|uniref:Uncharacterized protein n=1 Tax=Ricinus communis TaxID=3988 RepID=B9SYQ2_RICCO|nr:conserved hypothetical protein [Ricinus communis]
MGFDRSPARRTTPWLYHISKLLVHQQIRSDTYQEGKHGTRGSCELGKRPYSFEST